MEKIAVFKKGFDNFQKGFLEVVGTVGSLRQAFMVSLSPYYYGDNEWFKEEREVIEKIKSLEEYKAFDFVFEAFKKNVSLGQSFGCPSIKYECKTTKVSLQYETSGGIVFFCKRTSSGRKGESPWEFVVYNSQGCKEGIPSLQDLEKLYRGEVESWQIAGSTLRKDLLEREWVEDVYYPAVEE